MTSKFYGVRYKSVYISPLVEEIFVSFEENLLGATGTPAALNDWRTSTNSGAGYGSGEGESLEGDSYGF